MTGNNEYKNLKEFYVSESGHARLFTATKYGKRFMLKCLKKDFLYIPVYQQALSKEFEIGLQLEHPNICHTIELEQVDGLGTTIVMEYVDGDNLQTLIDRQQITPSLAEKNRLSAYGCIGIYAQQADYSPRLETIEHHGDTQWAECEDYRFWTLR